MTMKNNKKKRLLPFIPNAYPNLIKSFHIILKLSSATELQAK